MSMSDVEMWEKAVRWTLWCLMRQDLRQWSSDPQVQNLQTLKKSTDILKHGESVFAPLNPVLSKNRNMPFFATYSNPPKFSLDALTTLASKHLTICEQSIVFCEAKLPLLMGNYVLEATDTMQMAFVPWFSRSMAVNSGKAFHTYDICQSALRLRRFEREREIERTWWVSEYVEILWICGVVVQVRVTSLENGTSQACHGLTRPFQVRVGSYWLVQTVECCKSAAEAIYIYITFCPFCIQNAL